MQTAIFVDVENMLHWVKRKGPEELLLKLSGDSSSIVRKAYACWTKQGLDTHQKYLTEQGYDLEHHFHPVKGKNSADIHMTVDIMKYAYTRPDIQHFVLVSQDADFTTVFRTLRDLGKWVTAVTYPSTLLQTVHRSCHQVITASSQPEIPLSLEASLQAIVFEAGGRCTASLVKNKLLEQMPSFSQVNYGFSSFGKLLQSLKGIQCFQESDTLYVMLTPDSKPPTVQVLTQTEASLQSLESRYWQELAYKQWHAVSEAVLFRVHEGVCHQGALSRQAHIDRLALRWGFEKKQIRKALGLLRKAGLFYPSTKGRWAGHEREDILPDVDYALMCHLWKIVQEKDLPVDESLFERMVYGNYSSVDFMYLLMDTRQVSF